MTQVHLFLKIQNLKKNLKNLKNYFDYLNIRNITDNQQVWKTVKPFFFSKDGNNERITLIEGVQSSFLGQRVC